MKVVICLLWLDVLWAIPESPVGKAMKLVRNLSKRPPAKEVILFAVEVDAHEIHLHYISNILLSRFFSIEETRLIILPHSPSWHLIDFDPKRIASISIFAAEMNAFDLDIDVIQKAQQ